MEDNITVLVDAKIEYTKQLTNILIPFIFEGIKSIYSSTCSICKMNQDRKVLMRFQEQLSQIPKWNQEIIDEEYERIIDDSKCDWLDDLVTAVFLSHTKILTAIKSGNKQKKINLKIPKIDHFIHKCYIESAREFWKNPYIFSNQVSHSEYQRNINDGHRIIKECIEETIRKLLPVKNILREYLGSGFEDDASSDSLIPNNYKENLKKMVQKELEIVKNPQANDDSLLDNLEEIESVDIGIAKKDMKVENLDEIDITEELISKNDVSSKEASEKASEETNVETSVSNSIISSTSKLDENKEVIAEENDGISKLDFLNSNTENSSETTPPPVEVVFEEKEPNSLQIEELDLGNLNPDSEVKLETKTPDVKLETTESEPEPESEPESEPEPEPDTKPESLEKPNIDLKIDNLDSDDFDLPEFNLEDINLDTPADIPKPTITADSKDNELDKELELSEINLDTTQTTDKLQENPEIKKLEIKTDSITQSSMTPIVETNNIEKERKPEPESKEMLEKSNMSLDNEDIKQVKNIIDTKLYDNNIENSESEDLSDEETTIENIKFKKVGLDNLNLETLDSDFEIEDGELINFSAVEPKDLKIEPTEKTTQENLMEQKNTKTIIIEDESKKPLSKFSKPKKKNFKFFD